MTVDEVSGVKVFDLADDFLRRAVVVFEVSVTVETRVLRRRSFQVVIGVACRNIM